MNYIELSLIVEIDFADIFVAELAEIGFESFVETEDGIMAYALEEDFKDKELKMLMENYAAKTSISYSLKKVEKQNWNEEWEANFAPIAISDQIFIRATFHDSRASEFTHEIVITPKMSFGTGHHETTEQVMAHQLKIDHRGKKVLDVGTGTGILAILASKLGADHIHAFDIDEWSVENTLENIALNQTPNISVELGTIDSQVENKYDIVLANINRNILLAEINKYSLFMAEKGILVVSGFYVQDIIDISSVALKEGLKKIDETNKNNWAAVVFIKD
jgi:ribosomal protein L11 methyltransferase